MNELKELRKKVDDLDEQILRLFSERAKICRAIGEAKKKQGLPIKDVDRESAVYKRVKEKAAALGLDSMQVEAVYHEIVNMCSSVQE